MYVYMCVWVCVVYACADPLCVEVRGHFCAHQSSPSTMDVRFRSSTLGRRHLPHLTSPDLHGDIDCYTILHMDGLANKRLRPQYLS